MTDADISLYFQLKEGKKADLEVVATAALEWLAALRAAAHELEPEAQIRVDFVSADEASLKLNTVFEWLENQLARIDRGSEQYPRLRKLALALVIFVPVSGVPTYNYYFGPPQTTVLSEVDRNLLNQVLEKLRKNPEVSAKRQQFFRTVERDPSIIGVGVTEGHGARPLFLVPSNQFGERGGLFEAVEEEPDERTAYPIVDVTLISATLLPVPRSWTFQPAGLPEFKAIMKDKRFLAALEHAHVRETLRVGIKMTIRLSVKEKRVSDTWVQASRGRSVVEVIHPKVD